jgi:hypothetical protein
MSVEQRFSEYNAARDSFIAAHVRVRNCVNDLSTNLKALEDALLEADKSRPSLRTAQQKLEEALHADASGIFGTPLPPDITKVIAEATQAVEATQSK